MIQDSKAILHGHHNNCCFFYYSFFCLLGRSGMIVASFYYVCVFMCIHMSRFWQAVQVVTAI